MSSVAGWQELFGSPKPGQHIAQLYTELEFLGRGVAAFIGDGLRAGDAAVVIVTPLHWRAILQRLKGDGIDVQDFQSRGQLVVRDAHATLASFMVAGMPERQRFRSAVGAALEITTAAGFSRVRAFGEMVDILRRTDLVATFALEALWNDLLRERHVALLCGYSLDTFDPWIYRGLLQQVIDSHSDLIPVDDYHCFTRAVQRAYSDVFGGGDDAQALRRAFLRHYKRSTAMPDAEAAILALREFVPDTSDALLERARLHYELGRDRHRSVVA